LTTNYIIRIVISLLPACWLGVTSVFADNLQKPLKEKDNPQMIGKRDINKGQINFYSLQKEMALGRQIAAELNQRTKFVSDQFILEFVNRVTQNIVINSDVKVSVMIKVIDSSDMNAFTLPGGYLYLYRGLIEAADNEAELAGVIAHEVAHLAARHSVERVSKGHLISWASLPFIFLGGWSGLLVNHAAGLAFPLSYYKFSRGAEKEADRLAAQYLWKTGYDPQGLITFFEKLQATEKKNPGVVRKLFRTHPINKDRIEKVQKLQARFPEQSAYQIDSSDFIALKARLGKFDRRHRIKADKEGQHHPTLKRLCPEKSDQLGETEEFHRRWQDSQRVSFATFRAAMQTNQISLQSVDGKRVSLDDHSGQIVVLVFNATWVPITDKSISALQRIANLYEGRGVVFYWVSINSDRNGDKSYISDANLRAFARESGLHLTVLRDPERSAFRAFGLDALPSIVIIDRTGKVFKKHVGFDPDRILGYEVLTKTLNQLLG
jgi:peroxiredoxin